MADPVRSDLADGVLTVTLARPEKKNALDLETLGHLAAALERARDDAAVRVVVLRAEGDSFSAGGDIQVMRQFAGDAQATMDRLRNGLNRLVTLLHDLPKPVVAAVQGNAYGAGAILAFQCDLAVVAEEATFSLSFRHVGLIPDTGGTWLLPRIVGLQRAKHLTWTAAPFSAADAVSWGLAWKAVPKAQLDGTVRNLASALADGPVGAMGLAKQAMHLNLDAPLAEALDREARRQAAAFLTPEHAEGRDSFFERRKPKFR
ncbi:MAG TPA: enoyl-CoA hydratase-related protein [Candidatus Thermoplasmatota archaeon]|nr:enoyl-CoA hydratase-related protein [Candidatus Thermoplasmatota archaeon]